MKAALVNVPVRVNIWIRPECQRRQFEVLKQARPSIIILQSDGGRNEKEWEAIRKNREIFDNEVDWECTIHKFYEDHNNGLYKMGRKIASFIWENYDRCIFLEDDHIPAVSFFKYCEELLEKYKNDLRIDCICGMNHLTVSENVSADYFFSKQGSIWGTATWRDRVKMRDTGFEYAKDPYVMNLLKQNAKGNKIFWNRAKAYAEAEYYEGHVAGTEFWREFAMYGQSQLQIIPKYNMICNVGATANSAHADEIKYLPKKLRGCFNMKTYEIEFPLKHPKYVMPDLEYERKRNNIIGYNVSSWEKLLRRIERAIYKMIDGDILHIFKIIYKKKAEKNKIEQ